jgi:cob(I)alamin adenosyltransferase
VGGNVKNSLFTGKGDGGTTGLLGEGRVSKSDLRIETLGAIDEANAALGMARALCQSDQAKSHLLQIQRDLYGLMGEVAATHENAARFRKIGPEHVAQLETRLVEINQDVQSTGEFIVPGDSVASAVLDLARTIVRRAERRLVELAQRGDVENPELMRYLNRLSSYCYALELLENQIAGNNKPTFARG